MSMSMVLNERDFWMRMTYILLKKMGNHVRITQEDIANVPPKIHIHKGRMADSDDIVLLYKEK